MEDGERHPHNLTMRSDSAQLVYESIPYSINFSDGKAKAPFILMQIHACMTHTGLSLKSVQKLHYALDLCLGDWR